MQKHKILHLITSLNIGGTEKHVLALVKNLSSKYDMSVAYLKERGNTSDEIEKAGVRVFKTDLFTLIKYLKRNEINLIHTHLYRANILGRIAGKIANTPAIISSQRSIDGWKKQRHIWADRFTSRYCDLIIANSETAKDILIKREKISARKITVIYNGVVPTTSHSLLTTSCFTVGYVGRLHNEKGVCLLPDIAKKVIDKNANFKFLIIGDGPEKEILEKRIRQYNLGEKVVFTGWITVPENIYSLFDIILMPSAEESFPQALLEAFSYGIPAVAADVGGVKELVEDGKSGIIVKTNKADDFAAAILKIADNGYRQFCENAKIRSLNFSVEKMISSMDDIYENILSKAR